MESFFQISESFFELVAIFKIIVALGLCMRGGEAFVLNARVLVSKFVHCIQKELILTIVYL